MHAKLSSVAAEPATATALAPKPKPRNSRLTIPPGVQTLGNIRKVKVPEFLGVCESTFERLARQPGFPPGIKIGPRMVVWRVADLVAWRDSQPTRRG